MRRESGAQFVTADGMPLADVQMTGESTPGDAANAHVQHKQHNTGLVYDYYIGISLG